MTANTATARSPSMAGTYADTEDRSIRPAAMSPNAPAPCPIGVDHLLGGEATVERFRGGGSSASAEAPSGSELAVPSRRCRPIDDHDRRAHRQPGGGARHPDGSPV